MPLARPAPGSCRVCGSAKVAGRVVSAAFDSKQVRVMVCRECGHVAMPENLFDYTKITSETQFELANRVGTEAVPGRDFQVLNVSFDERDEPEIATQKRTNYLGEMTRPFPPAAWRLQWVERM